MVENIKICLKPQYCAAYKIISSFRTWFLWYLALLKLTVLRVKKWQTWSLMLVSTTTINVVDWVLKELIFCVPDKAAAEAEQDSFLQLLQCRNYLKTPIFPDWIQHRGNNWRWKVLQRSKVSLGDSQCGKWGDIIVCKTFACLMIYFQDYCDLLLLRRILFTDYLIEFKACKHNLYENFRSRKLSFLAAIDEVR